MNSFDNNTSINELEPGTDRAMDGLLQEFSSNRINDDDAFLQELESALDKASGDPIAKPIATRSPGQQWWKWSLIGSAAACAMGILVWRDGQLKQPTNTITNQPKATDPSGETKVDASAIHPSSGALDLANLDAMSLFEIHPSDEFLAPKEPNRLSFSGTFEQQQLGLPPNWLWPRTYDVTTGTGPWRTTPAASDGFAEGIQLTAEPSSKPELMQNGLAVANPDPSSSEIIKRGSRMEAARKLETEADLLVAAGTYDEAIVKLTEALSTLPNAPMSAELRAGLIAKFSNACIRQADKLGKMARFDDAKAVLNRVLVASVDPTNASARTLLKRLGDPDYYNPSLTESHYKDPNGVPSLMRQGIAYSEMGQYAEAEETFNKVLTIDPNNARARAQLEKTEKEIDAHLATARDPSRAHMLRQVDELWDDTVPGSTNVSGGIPGTGRGGLGGTGFGVGVGVGGGAYSGCSDGGITRSGTGTLTLSESPQGGWYRQRGVGPGTGLGFVGNPTYGDSTSSSDKYSSAIENAFLSPLKAPLSTFSVDVDTASYANLRRMILAGQSVPPAAVRIEEMVNYFSYSYPQPEGPHPFSVHVESAACPWNEAHRLVKIGLKAKEIAKEKRPSANLVFLCDVSGSMSGADKLELLVKNLTVLTNELNADDTVGIVVYAGNEGVALEPTSGGDKQRILKALNNLSAGGSTNGGAGINRAYQMAQERFIKGGINRVVLCTDGDFNVGTTSQEALVTLVEEKAKGGVFLTVCGYGQGNLNDSMMESITNKGNGVYHYVDSEKEGKKIFKDELFGTLMTVAKDVKLQVEFNPAKVGQYRLVGYDNRMLKKEDFANDKVDAGDIGAGHTVTALYEIIPPGALHAEKPSEQLKYQQPQPVVNEAPPAAIVNDLPEMLTVKLRYKEPEGTESKLLEVPHTDAGQTVAGASSDFKFASAVAEFGEWLRGKQAPGRSPAQIAEQAESARGNDPHGLRGEFIELIKAAGTQRR